ncbi:hypothetical protein CIB48_g10044 [Xylaria polymorpha]|nr:hypothetical protein CIB48_g10044 [Xylaria polymorpha]
MSPASLIPGGQLDNLTQQIFGRLPVRSLRSGAEDDHVINDNEGFVTVASSWPLAVNPTGYFARLGRPLLVPYHDRSSSPSDTDYWGHRRVEFANRKRCYTVGPTARHNDALSRNWAVLYS